LIKNKKYFQKLIVIILQVIYIKNIQGKIILFFCRNSKLILRHSNIFKTKKVFFLGNIQDELPLYLNSISTKINFYKYNAYINFKENIKNTKNIHVYNDLLISPNMLQNCDTIIYYWPKDKSEAQFQLINLISSLKINTQIFIVGENSSGIRSAPLIFKDLITLNKVDNAKHSLLLSGFLKKQKKFILENFFKTHIWKNFSIKSLPGVFGHKKIDEGSPVSYTHLTLPTTR
jgi:16S rRNA (guanine1207-N2)-methyltransferase